MKQHQTIYDTIVIAILMTTIHAVAIAAPDRKPEKPPELPREQPIPSLIGDTNWGAIAQNGRDLIIEGHPNWSARGKINKDGTISLLWTYLHTGETAPSHYRRTEERSLEGAWGFAGQVTINPDGTLSGETRIDVIRWLED